MAAGGWAGCGGSEDPALKAQQETLAIVLDNQQRCRDLSARLADAWEKSILKSQKAASRYPLEAMRRVEDERIKALATVSVLLGQAADLQPSKAADRELLVELVELNADYCEMVLDPSQSFAEYQARSAGLEAAFIRKERELPDVLDLESHQVRLLLLDLEERLARVEVEAAQIAEQEEDYRLQEQIAWARTQKERQRLWEARQRVNAAEARRRLGVEQRYRDRLSAAIRSSETRRVEEHSERREALSERLDEIYEWRASQLEPIQRWEPRYRAAWSRVEPLVVAYERARVDNAGDAVMQACRELDAGVQTHLVQGLEDCPEPTMMMHVDDLLERLKKQVRYCKDGQLSVADVYYHRVTEAAARLDRHLSSALEAAEAQEERL